MTRVASDQPSPFPHGARVRLQKGDDAGRVGKVCGIFDNTPRRMIELEGQLSKAGWRFLSVLADELEAA